MSLYRQIEKLNPSKVLILGPSGSGKSYGIRHLPPKRTYVICPDEKGLPFRGAHRDEFYKRGMIDPKKGPMPPDANFMPTTDPSHVARLMDTVNNSMPHINFLIIDTITAMMLNSTQYKMREDGWDKWNELGYSAWDLIRKPDAYRDDLFVFFMAHTDPVMEEQGKSDIFIPGGKILKNKAKLEIFFTTVVQSQVDYDGLEPEYTYRLRNDGSSIVKVPPEMFGNRETIPNDMLLLARGIRAFNEDRDFDVDEEIKTINEMPFLGRKPEKKSEKEAKKSD